MPNKKLNHLVTVEEMSINTISMVLREYRKEENCKNEQRKENRKPTKIEDERESNTVANSENVIYIEKKKDSNCSMNLPMRDSTMHSRNNNSNKVYCIMLVLLFETFDFIQAILAAEYIKLIISR